MKFEIPPVEVSDLFPFSSLPNSNASQNAFAGVSKNGLWMWIVRDTNISLYHTENREWFGGYCFGKSLKNPSVNITAVAEFSSSHISFSCLLIAVDQDDESIICMYDINKSKVVRAILVPDKVISLEVISGNGGVCMDTHHLFMQLRYMFGIVAVGTFSGHIYFLDLNLDEDFTCSENLPNITFVLKKYELHPECRERVISKQQHILMLLNDQSVRNGSFEFESRSSSLGHFPYGQVHVTALKYIPNSITLAVGFNFGGIQLWDLQDLCLLYTVSNQPQEQPIIAFAFQEPENDPRHFCYLWIIKGHSVNERPEDFSVATMYSLIYDKRTYVESFGYLYTELRNCFKRFEYRMTSDPFSAAQSSSAAGSCLLSCQTICQTDDSCFDFCSLNDSDTASERMSLCFLSWIVWSHSENTPTSYHLALFDLNQWYRAEMPSSNFRSEPSDLNPYFAHFSLEEVAQIFDLEPLLGLHVIPHSIKKFKCNTPSEEFFFPSALDYETIVFSSMGICRTTFMGLQRRLLYRISDMGPNVLVNPKDIYSNLIRCGLVSDPHTSSDRVPLIVQRETLMQLALEYHIPPFFMKCLKEWRYADSIQEGCTSRAMLNWAWKKVIQIKSSIDKLTIPLFNCSDTNIDKGPLKCLYSYRRQLDLIDTILMGYQKFAAPRTEQGIQELKCRKDVVFSINMYLQVMLWLRSVHVLPEVCEGDETEKNLLYPANALLNSYLKRRSHLRKIHSSIGPTDILLIDGLVKEAFNENTWQEKGGNGIYPPPSIYAALSCYLLDDVPLQLKHSLMYYLLLDICDAPHNKKSPMVSQIKKFPSAFGISQSVSKLVKAFWYLDQFNFEVAIKKLLKPGIKTSDILSWQHYRVIKSFLFQGEAQKALKYINHMEPPENTIEDMKLHLSVLLARGSIIQAFDYQRSKQSIGCGLELLNHLFLGCQETQKLKELIYMPLNSFEASALVKFLSESENPLAQETLVIYYLLRCNYFEAAKVNERLSTISLGRSVTSRERVAGREALVEGLLASIPKMEKNLINEVNRFPSIPVQRMEILKPLSLSIKNVPMKQITYSDILNSLISEASSAMCAPYLELQTPLKSINRPSYENLPFIRPPLTPEYTKIPSDNIHTTPVVKRTLTSPSSEFSSPSKRSRLIESAPFRTPLSKKKVPKHLAGDVASLLQSPPIPRKTSKLIKDMHVKEASATAPQGILKKKTEPMKFPSSDFFTARTPSVISDAGDSSDGEDDNEMIVDDAPDDIPGRQIRFSVPPKEDLNVSTYSSTSAESAVGSASHESLNFMKKLEDLKPLPSLEPIDFHSRDFIKVTQRKALLTREPLKSHSRISPEKTLTVGEHNRIGREKSSFGESASSSALKDSLQHENIEPAVEASGSDSCSDSEDEPKRDDHKITSGFMHSSPLSCTSTLSERNLLTSTAIAESPFNKSGSSSGNSSYNSASERSLIITPRRPLRDTVTSLPSTSMLPSAEAEKDQTMTGDQIIEEMIIDDDDYDDVAAAVAAAAAASNDHSGGEEEISIIGEVSAPPFEQNIESNSQAMEEECICIDIPDSEGTASESAENDNQNFAPIAAERVYGSINKPILPNEESLDIEQIFDSHEPNNSNNQLNDNQEIINNIEPRNDIQNQPFSNNPCQINNVEELSVNRNPSEFVTDNIGQCSNTQNLIIHTNANQSDNQNHSDIQNPIIHTSVKQSVSQIQIIHASISQSDIENQIIRTSVSQSDIENQIIRTSVSQSDIENQIIHISVSQSDIENQIIHTSVSQSDIENQIIHTSVSQGDIENQIIHASVSQNDFQNRVINVNSVCGNQSQVTAMEQVSNSDNKISSTEYVCDNSNQISNIDETKSETIKDIKNDTNEKTPLEEVKEPQSNIIVIREILESTENTAEALEELKEPNIIVIREILESTENTTEALHEEKVSKAGIDCVIKMCTDSTEVQVDESTESCSSEVFKFSENTPVTNVQEYVPIKERIGRSQQSVSQSSRYDDEGDDQTYPSLLLLEQMELEKYGELHESDKLGSLKCTAKPEKSESIADTPQDMETDIQDTSNHSDLKTESFLKPSTSTKDSSEKLTERFDFLSKNSEFYENNKLYRDTMTLLKSDLPVSFGFDMKKKPSKKSRTFVFKKEESKTDDKLITDLKSEDSECKADKEAASSEKFLVSSSHTETYEQFSSSIQKGRSNAGERETLKSSPNTDHQKSSISIFEKDSETGQSSSKAKGRKKQESAAKDPSTDKKERSSIRKAKGKGKAKKKIEFSFAEPHSPAGPEVLEALTTPSQYPVGSYMFSPPLTRGRLRSKRNDDTFSSSFASVTSETSFAKEKKPPVDPILQGIMDERAPETQKLATPASKRKTKASPKKKTVSKKSEKIDLPNTELSDSSLDASRLITIDSPALSKINLPTKIAPKHRMVLRQPKTKPRTEELF